MQALMHANNPDVEVRIFPNLNHLFQTSTTGSPTEYPTIEETMSPVAMQAIAEWVLGHGGR
jgi:hypothetical protein